MIVDNIGAVEVSICTEMDDKDCATLQAIVSDLIYQFTGTRQYLAAFCDPPPTTYPSDTCLVLQGAPTVLTEPIRISTISGPYGDGTIAGEEVLDTIGECFEEWLLANDEKLRAAGVISSNHRIDKGSIQVVDDGGGNTHMEVTIYPPQGRVSTGREDLVRPQPPTTQPEEKGSIWPAVIGGGLLLVAGVGIIVMVGKG